MQSEQPTAGPTLPEEAVGDGSEFRLKGPDTFPGGDVEHPESPKTVHVPTKGQCLRVLSPEEFSPFGFCLAFLSTSTQPPLAG